MCETGDGAEEPADARDTADRVSDETLHQFRNWVYSDVLRRQASRYGDRTWIRMIGGDSLTFGAADRTANRVGRFLMDLGVARGDPVAVMLPNCLEHCHAWSGITRIGAVHIAVNTDYVGRFLSHVLQDSASSHLFIHADYLAALCAVQHDLPDLRCVIVIGGEDHAHPLDARMEVRRFEDCEAYADIDPDIAVSYREAACVMYTSGTTGPSKGVVMPHAHVYLFGLGTVENMSLSPQDRFYIVLPLFHANGMFMQLYATLMVGAEAVIRKKFSASRWIRDVCDYGITITNSLGAVISFVLAQPPSPWDRQHRLRAVGVAPNLPELDGQLRSRFGIRDVFGLYGMTEVNIPLYTRAGEARPGSCGRVWNRYYELRIVDPESDLPVPPGETGEIVVRPKLPFGFMSGYLNMPEETVAAWRNFWFHTGDAARMDEQGHVYFVDRIKDCIRRRGENISSFEIEQVVTEHERVAEAAAVAVKSDIPGAEDEVMVFVVPAGELDIGALLDHCRERLPRFAIPRFVELAESLPKTPTGKVRKAQLRGRGVCPDTFDREVSE